MPGLGRIPQWDSNNLKYQARTLLNATPELKFRKLPWKLSGNYNQGETGTCVAHCGVEGYESTPYGHLMGSWITPFNLYREIVLDDDYPENDSEATAPDDQLQTGTSVLALMRVLKKHNVIPSYHWLFSTQDMIDFVRWQDGAPLFMGTNWLEGMDDPSTEGIVHVTGRVRGGHSFLCYWYDAKRDLFWFLNSWGTSWGVANPWDKKRIPGGCFAIPGNEMQQLLDAQGECAAAREWRRVRTL